MTQFSPPLPVFLPPRRQSMSGSVSTLNLLHAISEEEAVPWPEFNPNRRNSSPKTTPKSYHAGTATESAMSGMFSHSPIRVARSLGLASSSPPPASSSNFGAGNSNSHPGVTQSDTEACRLVGVVTSPLALRRRSNKANRLRAAQSFIQNSRESRSCSTNNSTNDQRPSSNTLSYGGGGCVRVRVPSVSSSPGKLTVQHKQHLQ